MWKKGISEKLVECLKSVPWNTKGVYEEVHESMKQETSVRLCCSLVPYPSKIFMDNITDYTSEESSHTPILGK